MKFEILFCLFGLLTSTFGYLPAAQASGAPESDSDSAGLTFNVSVPEPLGTCTLSVNSDLKKSDFLSSEGNEYKSAPVIMSIGDIIRGLRDCEKIFGELKCDLNGIEKMRGEIRNLMASLLKLQRSLANIGRQIEFVEAAIRDAKYPNIISQLEKDLELLIAKESALLSQINAINRLIQELLAALKNCGIHF